MARTPSWLGIIALAIAAGTLATSAAPALAAAGDEPEGRRPVAVPSVSGPLPGTVPGDRLAERIEDTYPFFSTPFDLASRGYVEEEFIVSGTADGWDTTGTQVAAGIPYRTRVVVRRPARSERFNGTVLVEWQNVTAGYDIDALWHADALTRAGYAWIGVSAQRVGVNQLVTWSPARYGTLDVTGGGAYSADELSYDIFAQAARAARVQRRGRNGLLGRLRADTVLAIGASQSAGRMTVYHDRVLPALQPVFDGYAFIVGNAPAQIGDEPVFQVLSETDVRSPARPVDTDRFRRWEVAGAAHSGHAGREYRAPIAVRDLGGVTDYACDRPPYSQVPLQHVVVAAYDHLVRWVERGRTPPTAEPLAFNADGTKARDELGLALGGIRLSQLEVPLALNTGDNTGASFCTLFGTHIPFDDATLARLHPDHDAYVRQVAAVDRRNVHAGYLLPDDARQNRHAARHADLGGPVTDGSVTG